MQKILFIRQWLITGKGLSAVATCHATVPFQKPCRVTGWDLIWPPSTQSFALCVSLKWTKKPAGYGSVMFLFLLSSIFTSIRINLTNAIRLHNFSSCCIVSIKHSISALKEIRGLSKLHPWDGVTCSLSITIAPAILVLLPFPGTTTCAPSLFPKRKSCLDTSCWHSDVFTNQSSTLFCLTKATVAKRTWHVLQRGISSTLATLQPGLSWTGNNLQ